MEKKYIVSLKKVSGFYEVCISYQFKKLSYSGLIDPNEFVNFFNFEKFIEKLQIKYEVKRSENGNTFSVITEFNDFIITLVLVPFLKKVLRIKDNNLIIQKKVIKENSENNFIKCQSEKKVEKIVNSIEQQILSNKKTEDLLMSKKLLFTQRQNLSLNKFSNKNKKVNKEGIQYNYNSNKDIIIKINKNEKAEKSTIKKKFCNLNKNLCNGFKNSPYIELKKKYLENGNKLISQIKEPLKEEKLKNPIKRIYLVPYTSRLRKVSPPKGKENANNKQITSNLIKNKKINNNNIIFIRNKKVPNLKGNSCQQNNIPVQQNNISVQQNNLTNNLTNDFLFVKKKDITKPHKKLILVLIFIFLLFIFMFSNNAKNHILFHSKITYK